MYLDAELKRLLREFARLHGESEAKVIREALRRYLHTEDRPPVKPVGCSSDGGVAGRVDDSLDELGFGRE